MRDSLEILILKVNKISDLGELQGFEYRRKFLSDAGFNVSAIPTWTDAERNEIIRRKYEIQKEQAK
jgi:hypothetical protein|tara:strand:+ start:3385 stop:3582 length:198 start_codon:yes stop_codon:yes gene_type:complete